MASFLLDALAMRNRALMLLLATAACSADLDIEIGELTQESASCNAAEDCPVPPGRCEEVDFCEGVCFTQDKATCGCEVSTECDDGNSCTQDICGDFTCSHQPITDGPGCCATVQNCPAPNACQIAVCAQSSCSYHSNGHPGCCNTDGDCDGVLCVNNTCGGATAGGADLGLSWANLPGLHRPGDDLTLELTVTNHGPDAATQIVVTLTFPTPPKTPLPIGCIGEGAVTCTIPALAVEASLTLEFHATAKSGVSTVTATVPLDSNSENDSAALTVSVVSESPGGGGSGSDGGCACGNEASVAGPVPGGLLWGVMVMLALRLGRRRR
jgi:Domain of unknown function DUF11